MAVFLSILVIGLDQQPVFALAVSLHALLRPALPFRLVQLLPGIDLRIVADRTVGALFFGSYHLMDYELMGGDGRNAIIAEAAKRNMATVLPPVVPFGSNQFPNLITPGPGAASLADLN